MWATNPEYNYLAYTLGQYLADLKTRTEDLPLAYTATTICMATFPPHSEESERTRQSRAK